MSNRKNHIQLALGAIAIGACLSAAFAHAHPQILDGGEQSARITYADTVYYNNEYPVITTREIVGGFEIVGGPDFEDIFDYDTTVTEAFVTIKPPSGESITITTTAGPTWTENAAGDWEATFDMPDAGEELEGTCDIDLDGTSYTNQGRFKIKKAGAAGSG